jgi:hypothetical protein
MSTRILALLDFFVQFVVETDTCDVSIGAVLFQRSHPLVFVRKH